MNRRALTREVKRRAQELGFDLVGICKPDPSSTGIEAFERWLDADMAAGMGYMGRPDRVRRTCRPALTLADVKSMVVVGKSYFAGDLPAELAQDPSRGLIASYAWGRDYHDLMTPRLASLAEYVAEASGRRVGARVYVDTGPLLERDAAQRSGLGFVGRNTMLIHPRWGAWLFLGEVLLDLELEPDEPRPGTCGRCTRCLVACPTDAFPEPYVLDSRRCISYLTIEHRGPIPLALRSGLGNRIFGCDICNEVCPYNIQRSRWADADLAPDPNIAAPPLLDLVGLTDTEFAERFGSTPVARARRGGFVRNVCVALGNWGSPEAVRPLQSALADHDPMVRGHAAWALGQIETPEARAALSSALGQETDTYVVGELTSALAGPPALPRAIARRSSSSAAGDDG